MRVLDELLDRGDLQRHGFTHFVGLTYGVDLPWFEDHLGRQLELAGVRRIAILADQGALDSTLEAQAGNLSSAGKRFVVQGIRAGVSFHPKAYLLAGPREARLYVGSGNLNTSGLARNREIFERWDARASDSAVPRSFDAFRAYVAETLQRWVPRTLHVERVLRSTFAMPMFAGPFADQSGELHGSPGALMELVKRPPTAATRLVMTAPFFDAAGEAACEIAKRLDAATFDVIVDRSMTNLSLEARRAIEAAGGSVRAIVEARRCHAKAVYAEGQDWSFSVHGSANFSNAAWRGHNAELVVFRRGAEARTVGELLGELAAEQLSEEAWSKVHAQAMATVPPAAPAPAARELVLHSAQWLETKRMEVLTSGPIAAGVVLEVHSLDASCEVPVPAATPAGSVVVDVPAVQGDRPVAVVRLRGPQCSGPWVVVHDPGELERTARGRTAIEDRIERLVQFAGRDPEGGADLLELLTEAVRLRSDALRSPATTQSAGKGAATGGGVEWHWVEEYVEGDLRADADSDSPDPSRVYALDPVRVIERLIGGDARRLGARSNEVEPEVGPDVAGAVGVEGGKSPAPPQPAQDRPRRDLLEAAEGARSAFVSALERASGDLPAEHLLTDVLVLAAALQSGVHRERLTDFAYANCMEDVLRAFLGSAQAPYARALAKIAPEERCAAWARGWLLIGPLLVAWHVTMARRAARGEEGIQEAVRQDALGFWFRNMLRHAPRGRVPELLREAERQLPSIERFSALWLADRWKGLAEELPFLTFVREVLEDAEALLGIEQVLEPALPKGGTGNATEGDRVIGRGRDGSLAIGFMDDGVCALLCDGAFQNAYDPDARWRFKKAARGQVLTLDAAEGALLAAGVDVTKAASVLDRIQP